MSLETTRKLNEEAFFSQQAPPKFIEAENVTKIFNKDDGGDLTALDQVSFAMHEEEFLALVGPSGCGKSTMLRILAGLAPPTAGTVVIDGAPVAGPRLNMGMMFQEPTLLAWRTVLDNVLLPIEVHRKLTSTDIDQARYLLGLVGLQDFLKQLPKELSGGMQQRVALSRTLMAQPKLMLLDEPFGSLDEFTREKLNIDLVDITLRTRAAVVLVTHSIAEAVFISDRVAAMGTRPGRILDIVDVPFERPRELGLMRTERFQAVCGEIRDVLDVHL